MNTLKKVLLITTTIAGILVVVWLSAVVALQLESHQYSELSAQDVAKAASYLDGKLTPLSAELHIDTFYPEPGVNLRTGIIDAEYARGTIVMVPGFTGAIETASRTIQRLNKAGYRVAFIEYRGQGKSWRPLPHPEKGYVESYAQLANDVALFAKQARIPSKPLFFFSISKGAHITMRMAAESDLDVSAYALVVPMVKINTGEISYDTVGLAAKTLSVIGLGAAYAPGQSQWPPEPLVFGEANGCNSNPDTAQLQSAVFAQHPELRTSGTTVQWLSETVASTRKLLSTGYMSKLYQPVKIFTAGDDRLVDTAAATRFCGSLAQCEVTHFEEARHCINRENDVIMDEIVDQSLELFRKTSG